jgi:hypothetical protein
MLLHGIQSVMPAAASIWPKPDFSQRQICIIHRHQNLFRWHPVKSGQWPDRLSTQIHERLRFRQNQTLAIN